MKTILGASWRTSTAGWLGLIASIGAGAGLLAHRNFNFQSPEWLAVFASFTAALGNLNARDNKVSSEAAGAVVVAPPPK